MYKVFLVEDEIVVREGIRSSIPWEKTPYLLAGESPDGEMALPLIQDIKPDILITDIRMPFMDGLALARIVKKTLPWIKIIILSGHDEFQYAREAISAGVEEYLLKPVSAQDMLQTLSRMAGRIDEEKAKLKDIENLKARLRSSSTQLRDKWLSDVVNGRMSPAGALEKGREFGVNLLARFAVAGVIGIESREDGKAEASPEDLAVRLIINSIMENYPSCVSFEESERRFALLIKGESAGEAEETVYAIAQAVLHEVERNTGRRAAVGIGPSAERLGELPGSFKAALETVNYLLDRGRFQIAGSDILAEERGFNPRGLGSIDGDLLFTKLKYAAKKDIDGIIREYTKMLGDHFEDNHMLVYLLFGEIIVAASKIVEALGGDLKDIAPFSLNQKDIGEFAASGNLFFGKIKALLEAVIEWRDAHSGGRYQAVIVKAREYIDRNFASGDLSLHSTASFVGISPNHLSAVFAQETGENFIEYLTRVRIEKAKQLLKNTSLRSADIACETGFNDPHYFSYIFKKNTGLSPREYRASGG